MEDIQTFAGKNKEEVNVETLVASRYCDNYLGLQNIQVFDSTDPNIKIVKAYLGWTPTHPYFGQILAILKYGTRFFVARFHVWENHQPASLVNRMTEIEELVPKAYMGIDSLEAIPTDFGRKAFWLYTPNSELDEESLALRSVARELKRYSVDHQLCRKFRKNGLRLRNHWQFQKDLSDFTPIPSEPL